MNNDILHTRDIEVLYELGCLRFIDRTWRQFLNPDFANLAEHTLRVIWIALLIAKHEKVANQEKIMKMALVHDITESRTGDVHYVSRQYTKRDEEKAIDDILKDTAFDGEMTELWKEYEKRECIEAKIVKDADNLEVDLELQEQAVRGHTLKQEWHETRKQAVYQKLFTETAKKLWEAIYTSNPHDWHVHGVNRFTSGDWKPIKS